MSLSTKKILPCGTTLIGVPSNRPTKVWFGLRFLGGQIFESDYQKSTKLKTTLPTLTQGSFSVLSGLLEGSNTMLSKKEMVKKTKLNAIEHNAIAGQCSFGFNLSYLKEKSKEALHIAEATLSLKKINDKEFQLEKTETLQEIARAKENGEKMAGQAFTSLFLKDSPFSQPILGTKESISNLKSKQLDTIWQNYCSPKNCVAVLAGNFAPEMQYEIEQMLSRSFKKNETIAKKKIPILSNFISRLKNISNRLILETHNGNKQTFVKLGFSLPSFTNKESLTAKILQSYLSGMGGPLFKLRSAPYIRNGIDLGGRAYVIGSRLTNSYHYGGLVFYTSLREEASAEWQWALDAFQKEIKLLKDKKLSNKKIQEAKNTLLAAHNLQLGKISFRAEQYAAYEILGIPYQLWEEESRRLKTISAEDVLNFCRKYLTNNNFIAHVSKEEKN